jgi:hypothetical protein
MGIKGLLPALKEYIQPVHISKYSGKRVSIPFFFFDNVSLLWVFRGFFFFFWFNSFPCLSLGPSSSFSSPHTL